MNAPVGFLPLRSPEAGRLGRLSLLPPRTGTAAALLVRLNRFPRDDADDGAATREMPACRRIERVRAMNAGYAARRREVCVVLRFFRAAF